MTNGEIGRVGLVRSPARSTSSADTEKLVMSQNDIFLTAAKAATCRSISPIIPDSAANEQGYKSVLAARRRGRNWATPIGALLSSLFLGYACGLVSAADWPQYRGPRGDGKSLETFEWPADGPRQAWTIDAPNGFSSFTVAGGRCFTLVGAETDSGRIETCLALDAATGREIWRRGLAASDYGHDGGNSGASGNRGGDGPRSTPVTDGKLVYIYDAHLVLTCFDAATGEVVWKHDVATEFDGHNIKWKNASSPVLHGDQVVVAGGGAGQAFLAFDRQTGRPLWKQGDDQITHATPSVATIHGVPQIVFFTQAGLVSIGARDGQALWRTEFPFSVSTAASPVVANDQVYCSAGYGVGAALFQINRAGQQSDVNEVWFRQNDLMNHWSTPLFHDGHLYGIYGFKKYGKAPLQCVELATGDVKWSERGFGAGNCILVGDKLVVLTDYGELVVVAAQPDEYHELGRKQVVEGKCWSTPAYSNGRVFVRSTQQGACYDL